MRFGNIEITKDMFPSYQIGLEYPTRQYAFMQDTLAGALNKLQRQQAQSVAATQANPQQAASPINGVTQ